MTQYLDLFLAQLDTGRVVTPKQAYRLRAVLGGSLPDSELDIDDRETPDVLQELLSPPSDEAQAERLRRDAEEDCRRLHLLLERLGRLDETWGSAGDPKAQAVRELIEELPKLDAQGLPSKIVIFTNYRDTAEYLFAQLGGGEPGQLRVPSNLSDRRWLSLLTGGDNQKRRAAVLERFAPLASQRDAEPLDNPDLLERIQPLIEESIELLVATDVLSEGQNLQDAQFLINYDLPWNPVRLIQRAGRIDRLNSPHERVYIHNVMPEQGLEDLLNLVKSLSAKIETIEEAVALDASVLGEQIEAREIDRIMAVRAGGEEADKVYLDEEKTQGLDAALEGLNRYLDIMRETATEELLEIPDGVYSVRKGPESGVYVMLRMPEDASGEVFWRWYPLGDTAQPLTAVGDVLDRIAAARDEARYDLPDDLNPFTYLAQPLEAAVRQIGDSWLRTTRPQRPSALTRNLKRQLQRDDLLDADSELWANINDWIARPQPADAARRASMRDPARLVSQLEPDTDLNSVLEALTSLWAAIEAEGLDRQVARPDSREPSLRDLELVAWELVVGPDLLG